jgi:superfamily II DNA or RNA helicase
MHHKIEKSSLVDEGHLLDIDVVFRNTEFKPYYDPVNEYSKMLSELTTDDRRNRLIASDVAAEVARLEGKDTCLVLSDRKLHCAALQGILKYKYRIPVELLTGDLKTDQRRNVVERVRNGQCRVLVATGQLVGEGFDCPNLSVLFLSTPIRFNGRVIQYLGRVLRPSGRAMRAKVYDYVDIHVAPLKAAARARARVYEAH